MALLERLQGLTAAAALANRATNSPEQPYVLFKDTVLTYGQTEMRSEALAASLSGFGVGTGDRVALILPPVPEFVISVFAVAKLGAVLVPINPQVSPPELQFALRQSEAKAAVTVETFAGRDFIAIFEDLLPQLRELHHLVTVGEEDLWYDDRIFQFEDALSAGEGRDYDAPAIDPSSDAFAILHTAGTTGKPKGVEVTHQSLLETSAHTVAAIGLRPDDRIVGLVGLFHAFGLGPGVLGTLLAGASMVLQDEFAAAATLDLVARHSATVHYGVPPLFSAELREQETRARDLGSLRIGIVAGGTLSDEQLAAVQQRICPNLQVAYSVTETSSTVSITRPEDPAEKRRFTVGRPLPGTVVRVLDAEGAELPVESVGEIAVRGPGVMSGYLRQPKETAAAIDDNGFLRTGDLGIIDEEGFVHLVGRRREVIIRSGLSVYPREVEQRLEAHPAVERAAAIGIPDDTLGEAICACLLLEEGALVTPEEIREWCRVALADYKVPDQVREFEEFPLTGSGKIRRVELARRISATSVVDPGT